MRLLQMTGWSNDEWHVLISVLCAAALILAIAATFRNR